MDAVTRSPASPAPEPPSAEIIDLAACRRARAAARGEPMASEAADPYPWAYTFRTPESR